MEQVLSICSDRFVAFASHHFSVIAVVDCGLESSGPSQTDPKMALAALQKPRVRNSFVEQFSKAAASCYDAHDSLDSQCKFWFGAMWIAAEVAVPRLAARKRRPWISQSTLDLIDERFTARLQDDFPREQWL